MKALEISQITFSYNQTADMSAAGETEYALRDFSMSVEAGEIHALLGPNGAGKTTLMRLITGQLRGYQGSIFIYGNKNNDRDALISMGYAPQPVSVFTSLTALENLRVFGVMAGLSNDHLKERSNAVLEETGLLPTRKNGHQLIQEGCYAA